MPKPIRIAGAGDISLIEASGLDAFLPNPTPYDMIAASAAERPDAVALHYLRLIGAPEADIRITYGELLRKVRQAANLFRRLGVGPEDCVAILMPHVPAGEIALWGAEVAGRACPINPLLATDHLIGLVRAAGAKVAVVLGLNADMEVWPATLAALRGSGCVTHVLDGDGDDAAPGSDGRFEDLLEAEPGDRLTFERDRNPDSVAAFFHTGGTTGAPKLALHTHRNQAFVARGAAAMYGLEPSNVLVNGFPIFHVAGAFVYGLSALSAGATTLIPSRLGMRNRAFVASIWKHVERYGVTAIGGVPTVLSAMNAVPVDADISSMRVMFTGGSPLPTELADAFERHSGKPLRNILGMTECAGVVTIEPVAGPRTPGATGLRLPFTEVAAFRDPATLKEPCPPGETGVIALRGPNVGPGYSDAARNPGTFEAGGWLVSGDLGHVDAEGRLHITGRAKDVIIRGAHNIDPSVIEDALLTHPAVAIAAAVGQPDAYAGELPVAFVTLQPGAEIDGESLRAFIAPLVAEPAALPKQIWVLPDLPMTAIGKIYKPKLRVLATRRAIELALEGAGIDSARADIETSEAGTIIRLTQSGLREGAAKALTGMPIKYEIIV